jgi:hypothetical protein
MLFGLGSSDYTSFNAFDPHMENPPNVNAMDVHRGDNFSSSIGPGAGHMNDPMVMKTAIF